MDLSDDLFSHLHHLPAENGTRIRNPGKEIRTSPDRRKQTHPEVHIDLQQRIDRYLALHLAGASQL